MAVAFSGMRTVAQNITIVSGLTLVSSYIHTDTGHWAGCLQLTLTCKESIAHLLAPLPPYYPKSRSDPLVYFFRPESESVEKELIHLADTTSANLSQIQGRELHNVTVQKTLISIYTNAWHWALPKLGGHFYSCFSRSSEDLPKIHMWLMGCPNP